MYDVIVVGARVAGASTAMLLARRGLKVLAVDRAAFPSDTLSTHQVQVPGVARLRRWGILDGVLAAGTPAASSVRFDPGPVVLRGRFPEFEGANAVYSPRRTLLDKLLVDAARAAGAEVRERFAFDELVWDGDRVTGIRGRSRRWRRDARRARLVVGADGRHSAVAKAVRAPAYHVKPALTTAYYTYWSGVELAGGEIYGRQRCVQRLVGAWPTNDGLVMTYVAAPASEFHAFRADPEATHPAPPSMPAATSASASAPASAPSASSARPTPRTASTAARPRLGAGRRRRARHGPGHGRRHRRRASATPSCSRSRLPRAWTAARRSTRRSPATRRARDAAALPMYEMTADLASFAPPRPEQQMLMRGPRRQPGRDRPLPLRARPAASRPRSTSPRATCCGSSACAGSGRRCARRGRCAHERVGRNAHDADLVRAAQAGDTAGLGALLERHRARLHAIAVSMLGHGPQAEDAVQDTFLIALRRIGELRDPAAARAWLTDDPRQRLPRASCAGPRREPGSTRGTRRGPDTAAQAIDDGALRDWVWTALERLSEPLRLAVMLRYFTGASSYEAIAEMCGVPVGTVRSRLSAAKAKLAEELLETAAAAHDEAIARWRNAAPLGEAYLRVRARRRRQRVRRRR